MRANSPLGALQYGQQDGRRRLNPSAAARAVTYGGQSRWGTSDTQAVNVVSATGPGSRSAVNVHPGYLLPTAAGGLIGANTAAQVHLHALAISSFGIGVTSWVVLSSVIFNRLFTRPALPSALVPTMAIELGIPAVAGLAYFAVAGRTVNFISCALGGYAVLMAVVQVRLIQVYRRLSFTPGFWSFAFAYAAAAADALVWLSIAKPPAATGYASAVIALLTAFVSWIAFRTVGLAVRGQLFPARSPGHQANS